jgi:glycosyltransferase involved in cell wall biosynthesis
MRRPRPLHRKRPSPDEWIATWSAADPEPLSDFALLAIIPAFCEEDVIGATVAHALAQGCDAVFVVDNGSPDGTEAAARAAGAEVDCWPTATSRDGPLRRHVHELALSMTAAYGAEHTWWLFVDADEFPKGPSGVRIREYLERLDQTYRVVGARFFNHLPTGAPQYLRGFHPAEFQPLCYRRHAAACGVGHFKHPLVRFDRAGPELRVARGAHRVHGATRLVEPPGGIITQHFQYRDEATTRGRLELVAPRLFDHTGQLRHPNASVARRQSQLDAVYGGDWAHVVDDGTRELGVTLAPLSELVDPADATFLRWYPEAQAATAIAAARGGPASDTSRSLGQ